MAKLVIDIETVGESYDSLDKTTKEVLTHWIKKETEEDDFKKELAQLKDGMGFSPLTGEIVAIGMLNPDTEKGIVLYQSPKGEKKEINEGEIAYKPMDEKEMLEEFWKMAQSYDEFITFNGMRFDVPFLMIRSAIHKIRTSKNLMSNRYLGMQRREALHIDLLDQLAFYGSMRRRWNLHLWCRAFGIKSPKAGGVTGDDVARLFQEGKYLEIAKYNVGDLKATKELYEYWDRYLRF